jgi:hypothetical protein
VTATTALRVSASCLQLLVDRTPPLVTLAWRASLGGAETPTAQAAFRDELLGLARDSAEASWRELRRGVDDLDRFTRPAPDPDAPRPGRPYRVKP